MNKGDDSNNSSVFSPQYVPVFWIKKCEAADKWCTSQHLHSVTEIVNSMAKKLTTQYFPWLKSKQNELLI